MTNEIIKKAFADAEKERQEKEISKIKQIVQSYLEKIQSKSEQKDKLDAEIRLLKKDLDDLKAGRLDRIKERQDKDERSREVSLIVIKEIHEKLVPYYPWRSPWIIECKPSDSWQYLSATYTSTAQPTATSSTMSAGICATDYSITTTGQTLSNFVGGSYDVNGKIINL